MQENKRVSKGDALLNTKKIIVFEPKKENKVQIRELGETFIRNYVEFPKKYILEIHPKSPNFLRTTSFQTLPDEEKVLVDKAIKQFALVNARAFDLYSDHTL